MVSAAVFVGCGGGGDDGAAQTQGSVSSSVAAVSSVSSTVSSTQQSSSVTASLQTGYFIDSGVSGLDYKTDTLSGVTGPFGAYKYKTGESVRFFLGNAQIGDATLGKELVYPSDVVSDSQRETNLARLLQTLDADGVPGNGIKLTSTVRENARRLEALSLQTETDVINTLSALEVERPLVSEYAARTHLEASKYEKDANFVYRSKRQELQMIYLQNFYSNRLEYIQNDMEMYDYIVNSITDGVEWKMQSNYSSSPTQKRMLPIRS